MVYCRGQSRCRMHPDEPITDERTLKTYKHSPVVTTEVPCPVPMHTRITIENTHASTVPDYKRREYGYHRARYCLWHGCLRKAARRIQYTGTLYSR